MDSLHEGYPDVMAGDNASQPLKGMIVCCTNVPDEKRTELNAQAEQMGASIRADLTVEVTHLVVGHWDSPKYHYVAQFRPDVRPMTMDWIATVRDLWVSDHDINMDLLERQFTLPTFTSLKISMTGCDDTAERQDIAEKIKVNGGEYDGNLTKQITHLISFRTEGNKYKAAKSWGLRIVSVEWLLDSLERGMILNEKYYDPSLPIDERGKGSWDKDKPKINSSKKRAREQNTYGVEEGKRKLRRTASTKLNTQSQSIWGDIVGSGNNNIQVSRSGIWDTSDSFAPAENKQVEKSKEVIPPKATTLDLVQEPDQPAGGMFYECQFWIHGFSAKHTQILQNHLVAHDGKVVQRESDLDPSNSRRRNYLILPSHLQSSKYPTFSSEVEVITDWWVERCLHLKKYLEPKEHVLGRPFPKFPIEGFSGLKISSAAFTGIDILHVKKSTELLGGTYSEDMTPQSSVLVTKSIVNLRQDKLEHAREWKIPIVTAEWLWDSIASGSRLPFTKYRCGVMKQPASAPVSKKESTSRHVSNPDRTNSEHAASKLRSSTLPSRSSSKSRIAPLDESAFAPSEIEPTPVKGQQDSVPLPIPLEPESSELTPPPPSKPEPLSEVPLNSHSAKHSNSNTSSASGIPEESIDISSLLAKTKRPSCSSISVSNGIGMGSATDPSKRPRQPRGKAIIGRALSNVSTASLASSVDSTATTGHAVIYPEESSNNDHENADASQDEMNEFMNLQGDRGRITKEVPPATQLEYCDKEGEEYRMRVEGIMEGKEKEAIEREMKEKAKRGLSRKGTIGDFSKGNGAGAGTRTSGRIKKG
ncbi:hypothetical protein EYC80_008727 [Monilinia laxa]|uniref:BRCT domain-containing protein n=1 Tax=Monilinia laxa TaxID=61186 RepID=A0A5N6K165_MONLA|nr:hypothetical protein EYC80_008727 [Monilinia laxa]